MGGMSRAPQVLADYGRGVLLHSASDLVGKRRQLGNGRRLLVVPPAGRARAARSGDCLVSQPSRRVCLAGPARARLGTIAASA